MYYRPLTTSLLLLLLLSLFLICDARKTTYLRETTILDNGTPTPTIVLPNQPNSPIPDPTTSSQQHHSGADEDMVGLFVHMWSKFKRAYKKEYSDNLEEMRAQKTFFSNMVHIAANQHLFAKGEISYEQAINAFSDVSFSNATHLNLKLGISRIKRGFDTDSASRFYVLKKLKSRVGFPNEFDWRAYEVETEVRDQGNCGSCWAFAVSGALEGVYSFFNRENVQFSPQELIDCSLQNFGCDGGWIDVAFAYLAEKKGLKWLAAEKAYPYQGEDHAACQNNSVTIAHYYESNPPSAFVLSCTGARQIVPEDEDAIEEALVLNGPVPAAIHVTTNLFMYASGVFEDVSCDAKNLNHAILIVGYGVSSTGTKYWVVKNSWGAAWGEAGYFKIKRGSNMCGIGSMAYTPLYTYKERFDD